MTEQWIELIGQMIEVTKGASPWVFALILTNILAKPLVALAAFFITARTVLAIARQVSLHDDIETALGEMFRNYDNGRNRGEIVRRIIGMQNTIEELRKKGGR